jgi:predicted TIM-barrel fold metal-dependent hydrolase
MRDLLVIDSDGHVTESAASLRRHLSEENRNRPFMGGESWNRTFGGKLGKTNEDPLVQLADMDAEGIDIQVIFPSHLSLSAVKETDLAVDLARAWNDWIAEFCATNPRRLKGIAQVALQDVDAAVKEVRRAVEELSLVGVMMPTNVRDQDIGQRQFWPFYEAVEGLGVGLALHGGIEAARRMHGRFNTFIAVHAVAFPFECMAAVTGLVFGGALEVFPRLRIAILEGCCGWLPFLMDRLDEEFELRGWREAPLLQAKPSEYLLSDRVYCSFEPEESTVPYVIQRFGAHKLLYASDYPHWDSGWPNTVRHVLGREDIAEADKRLILGDNPQRFYGFTADVPTPAGSA